MLKKTIHYTDYDGMEREEDFYFNLTESELMVMELSEDGGLKKMMEKIIREKNRPKIIEIFQKMIQMSYGEKSPDGKRFVKGEEISKAFTQTPAYDKLFMELATNEDAAINFIRGIVPPEMSSNVDAEKKEPSSKVEATVE